MHTLVYYDKDAEEGTAPRGAHGRLEENFERVLHESLGPE